jgi:hypothetical protein
MTPQPRFFRYFGIDYSGAKTPTSSLKGLRVYCATPVTEPTESSAPPSQRKYWTRREVAEWIVSRLLEDTPTIIGIDHGFSFPLAYFQMHQLPHSWPHFLDDFQRHWPTDEEHMYVDFVRDGECGNGAARCGDRKWRRITEGRARSAKSVFHFDVQGSVAKSTHAGLPWLRYIRSRVPGVHFWPFDGWEVPPGKSAIVEVYPSMWRPGFPNDRRTGDQHDAYSVAAWLRRADLDGSLAEYLRPKLTEAEEVAAKIEGWILGVM